MKLSCRKIQLVLLVQSVSVNLTLLCGLLVTPELIVMAPSVLCRWVQISETKGITQHERSRPEVAGTLCFLDVFALCWEHVTVLWHTGNLLCSLLVTLLFGMTPVYSVEVQRSPNVSNEKTMGLTEALFCLAGVNAIG